MIQVGQLTQMLASAADLKGEQKLQHYYALYTKIQDIEKESAKSWGAVSFQLMEECRRVLPEVQAGINRLEAGKRRREAHES